MFEQKWIPVTYNNGSKSSVVITTDGIKFRLAMTGKFYPVGENLTHSVLSVWSGICKRTWNDDQYWVKSTIDLLEKIIII